ncbi:MAG: hypothetical protein QHG99_08795 [Methanomicrobiales archaeon]|nr:hypothetical protein [Methanomicrobiales archaeon]
MAEREGVPPENAIMQLEIIETMYGLTIENKEEIAHWISDMARNRREALSITTTLNTWIALSLGKGEISENVHIPIDLMEGFLFDARRGDAFSE